MIDHINLLQFHMIIGLQRKRNYLFIARPHSGRRKCCIFIGKFSGHGSRLDAMISFRCFCSWVDFALVILWHTTLTWQQMYSFFWKFHALLKIEWNSTTDRTSAIKSLRHRLHETLYIEYETVSVHQQPLSTSIRANKSNLISVIISCNAIYYIYVYHLLCVILQWQWHWKYKFSAYRANDTGSVKLLFIADNII